MQLAESFGAFSVNDGPLDWWIFWRGAWHLTEIKDPKRKGHKHEYTKAQKKLLADLQERAIPVWIWRTREDVLRDFDARETA